jgi:hypothetical protein
MEAPLPTLSFLIEYVRIFQDWQDVLRMQRRRGGPEVVISDGEGEGSLAANGLAAGVTGVSRCCRYVCGIR